MLPVYNEADILRRLQMLVASALQETGSRYEIIFINDGRATPESRHAR
ncbi:MAG: glycosyltransferase [Planctomycetaceae bacterium]